MNKKYFFLILIPVIGLRLFFVTAIPTDQKIKFHLEGLGDEPAHFNYVKYLAQKRSLPVQTTTYKTPGASMRNDFEYYHPPLYYLVGAIGMLIGAGLYFCRLLSFFFGLLSLFFIAVILKRMKCSLKLQAAGILFCGFFPSHAYFSSLVSNDSMSWLAALALTFCLMEDGEKSGNGPQFTWRRTLAIGVLLGLGSYVKSSLLLFYPVAAASFFYSWYRRRNGAILLRMLVSVGGALVINIPWFLRNIALYHSITGLPSVNGPEVSYPHLLTLKGFSIFLRASVRFFWFPMQHIPVSLYHTLLGGIGALILIALLVLALRYFMRQRPFTYNHALLLGIMTITLAAFVQYNLVWGNREGRFLLPALSSIAFLTVVPLYSALKALRFERLFFPTVLFLGAWGYSYLLLTF